MSHIELVCIECEASYEADMHTLGCESCGSPLDVSYLESDAHTMGVDGLRMPVRFHADHPTVTLGEGLTPLVELTSISHEMAGDRGTATMLSVAREHGVEAVVEDSSGNAGASVSAYAARADISAHVFAPESAPDAKMGQIRVYDASIHPTAGPREASTEAAVDFQRRHGMVYASHNLSPYFVEGTKTFGYEVATQMEVGPDHIVIPVGNGSLLLGAWKAYLELMRQGAVSGMPKLHAIQAEAVMPIASEIMGTEWNLVHQPSPAE
ncbi:Threonine synthase [Geodia barretti]|uniref:Threonine synthase n=1 Tax=Geodia barretti TaxID=519541 RepID=A0AA35TDK2_GEOBA|nr:Threonine synthase [Geodia barretti]